MTGLQRTVMKFGGTSVGTAERLLAVADIVSNAMTSCSPVVVLSAMSGKTKAEGTTNRLLRAAAAVQTPGSKEHIEILKALEKDHLDAVYNSIPADSPVLPTIVESVRNECQRLKSFLEAAAVIGEISPRSRDVIIGVGEKLSCRIFTGVLQSKGVDATYVTLEEIIPDPSRFNERDLVESGFYDHLREAMSEAVRSCGHAVPVVTGYFGYVPGSMLESVGRGYTDFTAALIAAGLKAKELQVWKEVDGIFTADPRKVTGARLLPFITPAEAAELTYYGSEVIHPFTMEQAIRASIPIRIKNTFNPAGAGTIICPEIPLEMDPALSSTSSSLSALTNGSASSSSSSSSSAVSIVTHHGLLNGISKTVYEKMGRHPTAVTIKTDVIVVNVHSNRKSVSHGFLSHIFSTLDKYGIVVDLISTSEVHVSMGLSPQSSKDPQLERALRDLGKLGAVDVIPNMAILSLVGRQMRHLVGIAGKMFTTLAAANVNVEMISQGASEINISCIVEQTAADEALRAIHDEILLKPFISSPMLEQAPHKLAVSQVPEMSLHN